MVAILQDSLPEDMRAAPRLPGMRPVEGAWLRFDEAYSAQMARRLALLAGQRDDVLWQGAGADAAIDELWEMVLALLPEHGFTLSQEGVLCPDGRFVRFDTDTRLGTLGALLQCDLCLHEKRGDEHVLGAAVLCFPASWRLAEKVGRPLSQIHAPVAEYDANLARRVQRLFDGVQAGRPLWRYNRLWYEDPELHQPRSVQAPRDVGAALEAGRYLRAERQTVLRLPRTGWVLFAIHTYVVAAQNLEGLS